MKHNQFYICPECGLITETLHASGVTPTCCGLRMDELKPNTVEASGEKHMPVVSVDGDAVTVNVGSIDHPMQEEHLIEWVQLVTEHGVQRRTLQPGQTPKVTFHLDGDKPVAVYAYCNLHGLWKTALD